MAGNKINSTDDSTQRMQSIRAETRRLSTQLYELSLLNELWQATSSAQTEKELLESVLLACTQMLKCDGGSIFIYDSQKQELLLEAALGRMTEATPGARRKLHEGVAGYVAATQQPLAVTDIANDARFTPHEGGRHATPSFIAAPILHDRNLLGVISLHDKLSGTTFDAGDLKQLLVTAQYAGKAIEKLRSGGTLHELNTELEDSLDDTMAQLDETTAELERMRNHNESIVKSIPLALVTFDNDFLATFCNRRVEEIFGEDLCERQANLLELDVVEKGRDWAKELHAVIDQGDIVRFNHATLVPKLGETSYVVRVTATPLRDPEGVIIGGVLVIEDITERVRMDRMLAQSERHAVIGKLAARVAHELNNPLDGIMRFINLSIQLTPDNERLQRYLKESRTGLERMAGIVGSLLEFSRHSHRQRRNTQVNDAVREAVASLTPRAKERRVEIINRLAANLPDLACDMTQVVLNIAKNAIDAMPKGGTLTIETAFKEGTVSITVSDTGTGMSESVKKRIFDPFFTTKPAGKGTGLGLAISHDMIEKHRGILTVESEEGRGTTFVVRLPVS